MDIESSLEFFQLAIKLKEVKRAGWIRRNISQPESVADHTFGLCLLAFLLTKNAEGHLSREKCVAMALVHDLAEAIIGDITPFDQIAIPAKYQLEREAFDRFTQLLGDNELLDIWEEYRLGETAEAALIKDLDKIEAILQAWQYEQNSAQRGIDLDNFIKANQASLKTSFGQSFCRKLLLLRQTGHQ